MTDGCPSAGPTLEWVRERAIPLPPRCRERVDSLYLPAGPFRAPGDALAVAPCRASRRLHRRWSPGISQEHEAQVGQVLPPEPPVVQASLAFELHTADSH